MQIENLLPNGLDCSASNAVTCASSLMSAPRLERFVAGTVDDAAHRSVSRASSNAVRESAQVAF